MEGYSLSETDKPLARTTPDCPAAPALFRFAEEAHAGANQCRQTYAGVKSM